MILGLLKNRLLVEDLVRRHPEILDEQITAPDRHLRPAPHRDDPPAQPHVGRPGPALAPLLGEPRTGPGRPRTAGPGAPDPRVERTALALSFIDVAMPYFTRMHEMTVEHTHEEIQLLAIDFSSMLFETTAPMPLWRDDYLARDQRPSYTYLVKLLKVMQWLRGGTRWVLKSPQHLEQFPVLTDIFPDATFVVTHRDPVSVTASMTTMVAYSSRLTRDRVDLEAMGAYWSDRLARMLGRCAQERSLLPESQTIDVHFDEFMRDDMAVVQRIYDLAGQPLDERACTAMKRFMADHPRGKHGTVDYDLGQFGLEPTELRAAFASYTERFGVTLES